MNAADVCEVFNVTFRNSHRTCIEGGADEPLYQPADNDINCHRIFFRSNYASSALHEIAHWCLAGQDRLKLVDYGYWYEQSRDLDKQRAFEDAELAPQSLEWILSKACGIPFTVSCDNFDVCATDREKFRHRLREVTLARLVAGLPGRAMTFVDRLGNESSTRLALDSSTYQGLPN